MVTSALAPTVTMETLTKSATAKMGTLVTGLMSVLTRMSVRMSRTSPAVPTRTASTIQVTIFPSTKHKINIILTTNYLGRYECRCASGYGWNGQECEARADNFVGNSYAS